MKRASGVSVEELFQKLGETPMRRRARADSLFRRLRETDEDALRGAFISTPTASGGAQPGVKGRTTPATRAKPNAAD
ncbi:MAG: hypothetical protein ACKVS5_14485 [Parvularculaceae bacterium]